MITIILLFAIISCISAAPEPPIAIGSTGNYDYGKVLHASLLFYEAQRSGKLPTDNRVKFRGDSMLDDKGDGGEDLTGGYFDAGDFVKFGFPMAYSITVLAWGVIDYEDAYTKANELANAQNAVKWGTDYFIKAHTKDTEFYGQVGKGSEDHASWGRPEDWPKEKKRPAYKITASAPGSDLAAETAAALAAASIVFKKSNSSYSTTLLTHAKKLYSFANDHRGVYHESITDAAEFYKSWSGYGDELIWGAAWLYKATNDSTYKTLAEKAYDEFPLKETPKQFGWDDKNVGANVLLAQLTGTARYKTVVENYATYVRTTAPKSPKGMVYLDQWGPLRHAADAALMALKAAELNISATENRAFAKKQIDYALGDGGHSFVVGVGSNPPTRPHHRAASCPDRPATCDWNAFNSPDASPQTLFGALVGGPDDKDAYTDKRDDYVHNEVAMDYNAGFQTTVAGLLHAK
jgi:endoglucanase